MNLRDLPEILVLPWILPSRKCYQRKKFLAVLGKPTRIMVVSELEQELGADFLSQRSVVHAAFSQCAIESVNGESHERHGCFVQEIGCVAVFVNDAHESPLAD